MPKSKTSEALRDVASAVYSASHQIEVKVYQADSLLELLMERLREADDDLAEHWSNVAWTVQSLLNEIWDEVNGQWDERGDLAGRPEVLEALKIEAPEVTH